MRYYTYNGLSVLKVLVFFYSVLVAVSCRAHHVPQGRAMLLLHQRLRFAADTTEKTTVRCNGGDDWRGEMCIRLSFCWRTAGCWRFLVGCCRLLSLAVGFLLVAVGSCRLLSVAVGLLSIALV